MLRMLLTVAFLVSAFTFGGCSKSTPSTIYFVARTSPGANIHSINTETKELTRHTYNSGSRDLDFSLDNSNNLFFTSSRVLPEDRAERMRLGKGTNRRQDLNVFKLEAGVIEEKTKSYAQVIGKTALPETIAKISPDENLLSFVRTALPEGEKEDKRFRDLAKDAFDELYIYDIKNNTEVKITSADVVIKPSWSPKGEQLLFSTYDYDENIARLQLYNVKQKTLETLLENPWQSNQIDAPQWSPNGEFISIILHPRNKDKLRALYLLELKTKTLQKLSAELHSVEDPVSWSSDSRAIAYSALIDDGNLKVLNLWKDSVVESPIFISDLKGKPHQITTNNNVLYMTPTFSPDNSQLAVKKLDDLRDRKAELQILDLNGNVKETLHDNVFKHSSLVWK